MKHRILITVIMTAALLFSIGSLASADESVTYKELTDFGKNNGIYSAETSETYPWEVKSDGSLCSSNAGTTITKSLLKVSVKGSGVLSFTYKVCSDTQNNNALLFSSDSRMLDAYNAGQREKLAEENIEYVWCNGSDGWINYACEINADSDEVTTVLFFYVTKGKAAEDDDCAYLNKLSFSDGSVKIDAKPNDESLGTVSGGGDCSVIEGVTLTATPKNGASFYGWIADGAPVSYDSVYTFTPIEDMEITALFGETSKIVARNVNSGGIYSSVADAMKSASSGDTVTIIKSHIVDSDVTVPKNVTLYIPYSANGELSGFGDGTSSDSGSFANMTREYMRLTVSENVKLTVNGTLRVGAVIGYPGQSYQGHVSGDFGRILNNGTIEINDGGILDAWGYIDGSGTVSASSGATVYEPFVVFDYAGGTNTVDLNTAGRSPFSQYTMQNIRCTLEINSGAELVGRCNLYASSVYNKTDAVIVGDKSSGGILVLSDGAKLKRAVESESGCKAYCSDIKTVKYEISGGCSFESLTMVILGTEVSTSNVLFPIPYTYHYVLKNGEYEINTGLVLMPGAEIDVSSDATLTANNKLFVLDGLVQDEMSGKKYPSSEILSDSGYSACGDFIVNGKLILNKNYPFGGIVQSKTTGATITTKPAEGVNLSDGRFVNSVELGAKTTNGNNYTKLSVNGRVRFGDETITLENGREYKCVSDSSWTLSEYKVLAYVLNGQTYGETVVKTGSNMFGSFKQVGSPGQYCDLNGDNVTDDTDMTMLNEYLAGLITMNTEQKMTADINNDGKVNSIDATMLAKYLA